MAVKLTVVYDNPKDPAAFEKHYHSVHMPLAQKIPNVKRVELAKVFPKEDGSPTPAYRTPMKRRALHSRRRRVKPR